MADSECNLRDANKLSSQFLNKIIGLPNETLPEKLKTYFTHHRISSGLPISSKVRTEDKTCPYCLTLRTDSNSSAEVQATRRPGAAMKRILRKVRTGARLSPIEKKLAMRANNNNSLVISCHVCKMKATINARKPVVEKKVDVAPDDTLVLPAKKKKRKKQPAKNPPVPEKTPDFIVLDDYSKMSTPDDTLVLPAKKKKTPKNPPVPEKTPDIIILDESSKMSTPNQTTVIQNLTTTQRRDLKKIRTRRKKRLWKSAFAEATKGSTGYSTMITIDDTAGSEPSPNRTVGMNFIPLESSTPLVRGKNVMVTSAVTPCSNVKNSSAAKKKRRSVLQNLLAEEAVRKPVGRSSLKGFLSGL